MSLLNINGSTIKVDPLNKGSLDLDFFSEELEIAGIKVPANKIEEYYKVLMEKGEVTIGTSQNISSAEKVEEIDEFKQMLGLGEQKKQAEEEIKKIGEVMSLLFEQGWRIFSAQYKRGYVTYQADISKATRNTVTNHISGVPIKVLQMMASSCRDKATGVDGRKCHSYQEVIQNEILYVKIESQDGDDEYTFKFKLKKEEVPSDLIW